MNPVEQALRGAWNGAAAPEPALRPPARLLVIGAGGAIGAAVLAEALSAARFARVQALVAAPLASAVRGFEPLAAAALQGDGTAGAVADTAVVVFERERHSHGRDDAFVRPDPAALPALAQALRAGGVRRLLVVVPHAPALLPQALKQGLASRDEAAVAALGFEQLVFVRAAQHAAHRGGGTPLARFAAWWLSQLRWMVPQREQPLRAATLARCITLLAQRLPEAPRGTRVLAPDALWQAAQDAGGADAALAAWLRGGPPP